MMKYWKLELTCLSPVHIGSGEKLGKNQYVYEKGNKHEDSLVYFLNETKWAIWLGQQKFLRDFIDETMKDPQRLSLFTFLKNHYADHAFHEYLERLVKEGVLEPAEKAEAAEKQDRTNALNDISLHIKNSEGRAYIPGSSLKGAIRTAILVHLIRKNPGKYRKYWDKIQKAVDNAREENRFRRKDNDSWKHEKIKSSMGSVIDQMEKEMTIAPDKEGRLDMVNSFFRGLTVSDSTPCSTPPGIVIKEDLGERPDSDIRTIPIWRECIMPDQSVTFTLGIDESLMGNMGIHKASDVVSVLKEFASFQCSLMGPIWGNDYDRMYDADLFLGGGAGYLSKTLTYALAPSKREGIQVVKELMQQEFRKGKHERDRNISPHTLKLAYLEDRDAIMGMATVKVIEELKASVK